jgi:hypothetical protein
VTVGEFPIAMSRGISISYREEHTGRDVDVQVDLSRDVLGGQRSSMSFWGLPRLRELGITRLSELGVTDPVIFWGWDGLAELRRELRLLDDNLASVDFDLATKALWLGNLIHCYHLLAETAPPGSTPVFSIG